MSGLIATSGRVLSMTSSSANVVENYFPSGRIESRCTQVNEQWHGLFKRWHETGPLFSQAKYRHGLMNGLLRQWTVDGVMTLSATVKDGEFDGPYKSWWSSDLLKEEGTFKDGKRIGKYTWYKLDGSIWNVVDDHDQHAK